MLFYMTCPKKKNSLPGETAGHKQWLHQLSPLCRSWASGPRMLAQAIFQYLSTYSFCLLHGKFIFFLISAQLQSISGSFPSLSGSMEQINSCWVIVWRNVIVQEALGGKKLQKTARLEGTMMAQEPISAQLQPSLGERRKKVTVEVVNNWSSERSVGIIMFGFYGEVGL